MAFLNSLALVGLAAAAIPLLVHLLGRRRPRRVAFSAMAFLEVVRQQQFRRLRFRHWLLMAIRTLLLIAIALTFARPTVRSAFGGVGYRGQTAMVVILDDGPSMSYRTQTGPRYERARRRISDLMPLVGPGDWGTLIRTSMPDLVLPLTERTLSGLRDTSPWSGDGTIALRRASDMLEQADAAVAEVFIVSDLAGPPWRRHDPSEWPERTAAYLLGPVADAGTANLSVDSIWAGGELVRVGQSMEIHATIANTGVTGIEDAAVALWIGDRRVRQTTVAVPAGASRQTSFTAVIDRPGWISGRVRLMDDPMVADNARWFAVSVPTETTVLIVGDRGESHQRLEAILSGTDATYEVEAVAPEALTREAVERADAIVLNELVPSSDRAIGWIASALRSGAGLVLIAGPATDLRLADSRILPLIGAARFTGIEGRGSPDSAAYFTLDPRPSSDPLVDGLLGTAPASQPRFAEYAALNAPRAQVVIALNNGMPWLTMGAGSAGRGAVIASGLNSAWSDLAYRGVVVPLIHRIVNRLARSVRLMAEQTAGYRRSRALDANGAELDLIPPDGGRRRLLPAGGAGRANRFDLGTLSPPGRWEIVAGERLVEMFAVNLDPAESDLHAIDVGTLEERTGLENVTRLGASPVEEVEALRRGTELDAVFLLIALACMAAELRLMRGVPGREAAPERAVA